jgi:hypothetical protein
MPGHALHTRSHLKNTMQARLCELRERENAGRKRAQVYPLRYSEHVFSLRRRYLVAQRAAAQGIFEMASKEMLLLSTPPAFSAASRIM